MSTEWFKHIKGHGKYRSKFEYEVATVLEEAGVKFQYEPVQIPYRNNTGDHFYIPDFLVCLKDGTRVYLEVKGFMPLEAAHKMQAVKYQNAGLNIWCVFQNGKTKVGRRRSTNLAWAKRNGFPAVAKTIPSEWLEQFMTHEEWERFKEERKRRPG